MSDGTSAIGPHPRKSVWPRLLGVLLLVMCCAVGGFYVWHKLYHHVPPTAVTATTDPRLVADTPYRNVRPDVGYVGDAVCAGCHSKIADSYRHHPMARSLTPVSEALKKTPGDKVVSGVLDELPIKWSVETHDGRMIQRVRGQDPKSTLQHEDQIDYLLGSGSRGQSALIDRDGLLFQSPISWFRDGQHWGLAPGYQFDLNFDRRIRPECLFCHANRSLPVAGTENRYHEPVFEEFGIGCERCHGPGQLHVDRQSRGVAGSGPDDTIVNPAKLPPALREAVCQQCHLTAAVRLLRAGRDTYDYRPGLPLHEFWAAFIAPHDLTDNDKAVGQVEQMYGSRCFQESKGQLGCISCHDPHAKPPENEKVAYYRDRCLQCHTAKSCTLPLAKRRQQSRQDNCIQCHMPRIANSDIAHSAGTDHRILRRPGQRRTLTPKSARTGSLLVNFYGDQLDLHDTGKDRDLGVALMLGARGGLLPEEQTAQQAELLLRRVAAEDAPAREARAWALWFLHRPVDALAETRRALKRNPTSEPLLEAAASFSGQMGRVEQTLELDRRLVALNPWNAVLHGHMAQLQAKRGRWTEVEKECRAALRSDPTHQEAHRYLVLCMLEKNRPDLAEAEMNTLLSLKPPNAADLRSWFKRQMEHWRQLQQ